MPLLMGHMVGGWIFGRITQRITKVRFTHLEWGLLLFGSLLPDADHLLVWLLDNPVHRVFTHSILFLFLLFGGVYIISCLGKHFNNNMNPKMNAMMVVFGALTHIILDMTMGFPGIALFWPQISSVYFFAIKPFAVEGIFVIAERSPKPIVISAIIDMCIGGAWIGYFFITKRIRF